MKKGRKNFCSCRVRDEGYVIELCDDVLGLRAVRGYRGFEFLVGDVGKSGRRVRLPVDAYYEPLKLVVEYNERQHYEPVGFFDHNERLTISGVTRGQQRMKYDALRKTLLPEHGIALVVFAFDDFECGANRRLRRTPGDRLIVQSRLAPQS